MSKFFNITCDEMQQEVNPERSREIILAEVLTQRAEKQESSEDEFGDCWDEEDFNQELKGMKKKLLRKMKKLEARVNKLESCSQELERKNQLTDAKVKLICDSMGRFIIAARNQNEMNNKKLSNTVYLEEGEYREI